MTFLYLVPAGYVISQLSPREFREHHQTHELIRTFRTLQDCRNYCSRWKFHVIEDVKKSWTGITPEGRELMREKKRGHLNPNHGGLSPEHKMKISRNKKQQYRGDGNPMYGRKHHPRSKMKTSWSLRKLPKRRWCVDPTGKEHFLFAHSILPPGWAWGRHRHAGKSW